MVITRRSAGGIAAIWLAAVVGVSATAWFAIDRAGQDITTVKVATMPTVPALIPTTAPAPAPAPTMASPRPTATQQRTATPRPGPPAPRQVATPTPRAAPTPLATPRPAPPAPPTPQERTQVVDGGWV